MQPGTFLSTWPQPQVVSKKIFVKKLCVPHDGRAGT